MKFDLAGNRARLMPEREAVWFNGRWYSYGEMNTRAERLAGRLAGEGVRTGDRVAILADNHIAHIDLILAAPKLGFIYTPFNTRLAVAEQRRLAQTIEPCWIFHDGGSAQAAHALAEAGGATACDLAGYTAWLDGPTQTVPAAAIGDEEIHMLLFTGGSTGLPKAAMIPYRQVFQNAVSTQRSWGLRESDCAIQATPCFHAAVNVLTTPLLQIGGRVVLMPAFQPGEYLRLAAEHRASLLFLVPTMYQMLAKYPEFGTADLSAVRWAVSGGAPAPAPVREAFAAKHIHFRQGYGLTEAGVNCFAIDDEEAMRHPESVGRPVWGLQAVVRAENGEPMADGEVGDLTLAGPQVFAGYFRQPEETAEALRDGWLWTGDLARMDENGLFFITGRRKEMYISGGENVFPAEIEAALYAHPAVAECAVLGVPDEHWGETGLAAVVATADLDQDALVSHLRERLAGYKCPRHFLFVDALPKSGAGKILKPEIRRLFDRQHRDRQPEARHAIH